MFATLFASLFVQGILLGLAALALLAAAPRLQKRYGPQWLCRLWVTLAVLLLVPLHALVPQAPAAVSVDTTPLYSRTALSQEVTERPADGVPYMVAVEGGAPTGYIVPRAELQTGHRTVLECLAVGATRLNLLALAWNLGVLAVALYQFGGYAVWRIRVRRTAQPVDPGWRSALPQGACPRMVATPLVRSPMVAGTLHPVLLTPTGTAPNGADYMLAHELTHIKRHDVAKKLLFTLACAVHWYNPAVWLLAARAGRDIEEACDAETLCGRDADCRAAYADALLTAVRQNADQRLCPEQAPVQAASGRPVGHCPQAPRTRPAGGAGPDCLLCGRAGRLQARRRGPARRAETRRSCRTGAVRDRQPHRDPRAAARLNGGGCRSRAARCGLPLE